MCFAYNQLRVNLIVSEHGKSKSCNQSHREGEEGGAQKECEGCSSTQDQGNQEDSFFFRQESGCISRRQGIAKPCHKKGTRCTEEGSKDGSIKVLGSLPDLGLHGLDAILDLAIEGHPASDYRSCEE